MSAICYLFKKLKICSHQLNSQNNGAVLLFKSPFRHKTPEGGTPHTKWVGMLVISLRGVNFGFWSHLGCSGQNAIIFSREGLV